MGQEFRGGRHDYAPIRDHTIPRYGAVAPEEEEESEGEYEA